MVKTIDEALDLIYSFVDYSMTHAKDISNDVFLDSSWIIYEIKDWLCGCQIL